ncbi:MAG: YggS family pyridoxal phosphate-dependent enzyme [Thiohalomonadaceae bacterium]
MAITSSSRAGPLAAVQQRIEQTCQSAGRPDNCVQLLAVSKTRPAEMLRALAAQGQRRFGENYLQEALEKIQALADLALEWHFIGPIQSNKTRAIAEHFAWVHSVDRLKLAQRLSAQRPTELPPLNICLQVNISAEQSKSGVSLAELPSLAQAVAHLPGLRLRGLMAIPAPCQDPQQQRLPFRALAEAMARLNKQGLGLDTLSMGMSDDLEAAIAEGATLVRVGTALFGPRVTGDMQKPG